MPSCVLVVVLLVFVGLALFLPSSSSTYSCVNVCVSLSFFPLCHMQPLQVRHDCLCLFCRWCCCCQMWNMRDNRMFNLSKENCHTRDILLRLNWSGAPRKAVSFAYFKFHRIFAGDTVGVLLYMKSLKSIHSKQQQATFFPRGPNLSG